jgi:hypothetical protein
LFDKPQQTSYRALSFTQSRETAGGHLNQVAAWPTRVQHEWVLRFTEEEKADFLEYIKLNAGKKVIIEDEFGNSWEGYLLNTDFEFYTQGYNIRPADPEACFGVQIWYCDVLFDGIKL